MVVQSLNGLSVRLKEEHDLSFLDELGQVFYVNDALISGNLSFGIHTGTRRLFVKYAGAQTLYYPNSPETAVRRLQKAIPLYQLLENEPVNQLEADLDLPNGIALVFPWINGISPHSSNHLLEPVQSWPLRFKLNALDQLYSLFAKCAKHDYLAAGIDDGNFLIEPLSRQLYLTSVDWFLKMPHRNVRGRIPGASWYIAPEGYQLGARIDELSVVYTMGALAMAFFGNRINQKKKDWRGPENLFFLASAAVSEKKEKRPYSVQSFLDNWRQSVLDIPISQYEQ